MRSIIFSIVAAVSPMVANAAMAETQPASSDTMSMNEITVTANRHKEDLMHIPQSVSIISGDEIRLANPQTTADLLASEGLLSVQKSQQGGGSPMIRGFESSRVLLVVDGVRMNNLIYRGGHLQNIITVDPNALDHAEIIYGPSSVAYGSDALGGTVVLATPMPEISLDGKASLKGNAMSRYSSVNHGTSLHAGINVGGKRFASYTSLTYNKFGDLYSGRSKNPFLKDDSYIFRQYEVYRQDGKDLLVDNNRWWVQLGSAYSQYDLMEKLLFHQNEHLTHLLNVQFSNSSNIPRYDRLTDMKGDKPKFAEWYYGPQTRLMAAYTLSASNWAGADNASLIVAYQNLKESRCNRKLNDPWLGTRKENVNIVSLNSDWIKDIDSHRIHAGIDASLQFLKSTAWRTDVDTRATEPLDTRYPDGHNHMHNIDLFASHTWNINHKWTFSDGLRIGYSSLRANFITEKFFPFLAGREVKQDNPTYSLSAGIVFNPVAHWKLALNISTGYRVPNIDDVGKVFDSEPGMVVVPNPDIKPEKTVSADFNVMTYKNGLFEWNASLFATYLFDAIALAPATFDGQDKIIYDGELSDVYSNRNNSLAYVLGASTSLKFYMSKNFSADANLSYNYGNILGRNGQKKQPLDHVAPLYGRVGVVFESNCKRVRAEFFSLFNGKKPLSRYNLNGEDNIGYATVAGLDGKGLPAWFTLNMLVTYSPFNAVTIQGGIDNILNTLYRTFASGINAPGRNLYATLRLAF